jgi:hypothetical protein
MSDEIQALVDSRWSEYGIDADAERANGQQRRSLRQLLRR